MNDSKKVYESLLKLPPKERAVKILNLYRNLHYTDSNSTEQGILANALNDILPELKEVSGTRCWFCGAEMIWGADFDFEDYDIEGEGIVATLSCPNCDATAEFYTPMD